MKRQRNMKRYVIPFLLFMLAVAGAGVLAQSGGGYDLSWNTVDGGGGTSSGSGYELSGTIGQADAGETMSGGDYALTGGFWAGAPCAAPAASAARSGGSVVFSWPNGAFDVYRAVDDPYFTGGAQIGTGVSTGYSYGEALLGNAASNAYYTVGHPAGCSKRLGEFDFALVPGS